MKVFIQFVFVSILIVLPGCMTDEYDQLTNDEFLLKPAEDGVFLWQLNETPRPFKGTTEATPGSIEVECGCESDDIVSATQGSGELTHLGKVSTYTTACVDHFILDNNGNPIGSVINKVCIKLVAPNGDMLNLSIGPHQNLFNPSCQCVYSDIEASIIGGTGRFEYAQGLTNIILTIDVFSNPFLYTSVYNGEIVY